MDIAKLLFSFLKPTPPGLAVFMILLGAPSFANQAHVDSVNNLGRDYVFSNIATSIDLYRDLADESQSLGYDRGQAQALQNLAIAYALNGLFEDSTEAQLNAIRLLEQNNLQEDLARAYGDLGYQIKRQDLPLGKKYMRMGINIAELNEFKIQLCGLYDNYGVLQEMDADLDSAAYYFRRALDLKYALDDSIGLPFSLNNLASIHAARSEYAAAESLLTLSDAYHQRPENTYGRLVNSVHWGDLYFSQNRLVDAEQNYLKSLDMPGALEMNFLMVHCYQQLALIYEEQNDFARAYQSQQRFTAYRDSLVTVDTNARIAGLEIEFESEKKDRLLAENQLAIEAHTRQLVILGAVVILLAAAGLSVVRYQQFKRHQLRRELELRAQLRRAEYEQRMTDEKLRISRELHDNIGAQLTFLISSMDTLSLGSQNTTFQDKLNSISEFGRTTLTELRQTVWAMKHENDGLEALVLKLHELKRQCSASAQTLNLEIECAPDTPAKMSSARILSLYRITQEAVQNAVKHAGANKITVRLEARSDSLTMSVFDDGKGFSRNNLNHTNGLDNMQHRCSESGGEFTIQSDENGTRLTCSFSPE